MARGSSKRSPTDRDAGGESTSDRRAQAAAHAEQDEEQIGPVAFTRLRKDDGRALILYTHEEP